VRSSVLLGVDCGGGRFGTACLLLQPDRFLGGGEPLALGALLDGLGRGLLCLTLALRAGLLPLLLGLRLALLRLAVGLDLILALLRGNLVLKALALDLGLGSLRLDVRLGLALACLGGFAGRYGFGFGLSLLEAAFARELVVADGGAGELLRLAGELADETAGRSL
jgi:hypothetical protein